jgi:hypothetical protein
VSLLAPSVFDVLIEIHSMFAVRQYRALRLIAQKGPQMLHADRCRAKPKEYSRLARAANGLNELRDCKRRERNSAELEDDAQRVTETSDQAMRAKDYAVGSSRPDGKPTMPRREATGSTRRFHECEPSPSSSVGRLNTLSTKAARLSSSTPVEGSTKSSSGL